MKELFTYYELTQLNDKLFDWIWLHFQVQKPKKLLHSASGGEHVGQRWPLPVSGLGAPAVWDFRNPPSFQRDRALQYYFDLHLIVHQISTSGLSSSRGRILKIMKYKKNEIWKNINEENVVFLSCNFLKRFCLLVCWSQLTKAPKLACRFWFFWYQTVGVGLTDGAEHVWFVRFHNWSHNLINRFSPYRTGEWRFRNIADLPIWICDIGQFRLNEARYVICTYYQYQPSTLEDSNAEIFKYWNQYFLVLRATKSRTGQDRPHWPIRHINRLY